jgi:alpha-glucosidase
MANGYAVSYPPVTWYDFWTGEKMPPQPHAPDIVTIANAAPNAAFPMPREIHPPLETLPVYARGGSILPLQPLIQSTDETPSGPLELRVYPGENCGGSLYLDDGHTFAYQHGEYLRQSFSCEAGADSMRVKFHAREGSYAPWWKSIEVVIYNWPSPRAGAKLAGSSIALKTFYDPAKRALHVIVPDESSEAELSVEGKPR